MAVIAPRSADPPKLAPAFSVTRGKIQRPSRVVLYGPGGVGKSTAAALAPDALVIDLEGGTSRMDVARVEGVPNWEALRGALQSRELVAPFKSIVIDSGTKAEDFDITWTLANVPTDKGHFVKRIEDYGYGKGFQQAFDTWLPMLADCDRLVEQGKNIILICHECINDTPNPEGENFIRYEPRLQAPKSGKASIRDRTFEWADHVGYLAFDVMSKDGKGRGNGTRTLYFDARPTWRAKGRGDWNKVIPWNDPKNGKDIWSCLL